MSTICLVLSFKAVLPPIASPTSVEAELSLRISPSVVALPAVGIWALVLLAVVERERLKFEKGKRVTLSFSLCYPLLLVLTVGALHHPIAGQGGINAPG